MAYQNQNNRFELISFILIGLILVIYFQIYYHYWFVQLLGGYMIRHTIPVYFLFFLFIIKKSIHHEKLIKISKNSMNSCNIALFIYFFLYMISIFLNQEGQAIRNPFVRLFISVALFWMITDILTSFEKINISVRLLLVLGFIFSFYVVYLFSTRDMLNIVMTIQTNIPSREISLSKAAVLTPKGIIIKYVLPGLGANTFAAMLIPLVLTGIYFFKNNKGKIKYIYLIMSIWLFFTITMSYSRGAFLPVLAGIIYLIWMRWFKVKKIIIIMLIIFSILFTNETFFFRILSGFESIFHVKTLSTLERTEFSGEKRLLLIKNSLMHITDNPLFGYGFTNLANDQNLQLGTKEHNHYISLVAEAGFLTFIPYLIFLFLLVNKAHKINRLRVFQEQSTNDLGTLLIAGTISFLIYYNFAPADFYFVWIWFGLTSAWTRICEKHYFIQQKGIG